MFTDLLELKAGDMVYIHVLDEVLAYEVDGVNTVLPGDTSLLDIEPGKDFLTLITCTPVGVNTHRLLVHCSRVPYAQEEEQGDGETVPETSTWQRQYFTGIGCGAAALLLVLICYGLISVWRRKHGKPTKIYVKQFAERESTPQPVQPKSESLHGRNMDGHTPENRTSGKRENSVHGVSKPDGNYTDKNNTENSYTDPSIYPSEAEEMIETVREQIDYPLLAMSYMNDDPDCILELICHVLCSTAPNLKITLHMCFLRIDRNR